MKVLFYHLVPFALAHGGLQTQVLRTFDALKALGVEVEFLRWWDGRQSGDVLHFFGRISADHLRQAHHGGIKVVQAELLTEQGSRSPARLKLQTILKRVTMLSLPRRYVDLLFHWDSYRQADACVALTEWEAFLMQKVYGAPPEKTHVIPNGVEDVFLNSLP